MSYVYNIRYLLFSRKGDMFIRFHDLSINLKLKIKLTEKKVELQAFKITKYG